MKFEWNVGGAEAKRSHGTLQFELSAGWLAALTSLISLTIGCAPASDSTPEEGARNTVGIAPGTGCTQGQQVACACAGGQPNGVQVCTATSVWDVCQCGGVTSGAGGTLGTGGAWGSTGGDASASGGAPAGTGGTLMATGGSAPGSGGSGDDPCATPVTDMITDMEMEVPNEPPTLNDHATRRGPWYSSKGDGASITGASELDQPIAGGRCASTRAVHAEGDAGASEAIVGFDFDSSAGVKTPYTLTGTGISFFAKGEGIVRIEISTTDLDPAFDCPETAQQCYGYHGAERALATEWARFDIPYAEFVQAQWSSSVLEVPLNKDNAIGIQFKIDDGNVDFWIDDVGFY